MGGGDRELTLSRLTSSTVHRATGRGWEEWLDRLDAAGAADWSHKETVAFLERAHPDLSGWWRQSVAVGYEQARGRAVGETADAGYQVGVQRTVAAPLGQVWDVLTARPDLWLGEGATIEFEPGSVYEVPAAADHPSASGEVRVVKPGDRLRLTWQPATWSAPATLQLALTTAASGKTTITAHAEKLPDAEAREAMRARWREALGRITSAIT